jgi:pilus assembly protein Flp/PilA
MMKSLLSKIWQDEQGQGMVEYGLIIALVAIVVIVVLTTMGGQLKNTFTTISDKLSASSGA